MGGLIKSPHTDSAGAAQLQKHQRIQSPFRSAGDVGNSLGFFLLSYELFSYQPFTALLIFLSSTELHMPVFKRKARSYRLRLTSPFHRVNPLFTTFFPK